MKVFIDTTLARELAKRSRGNQVNGSLTRVPRIANHKQTIFAHTNKSSGSNPGIFV